MLLNALRANPALSEKNVEGHLELDLMVYNTGDQIRHGRVSEGWDPVLPLLQWLALGIIYSVVSVRLFVLLSARDKPYCIYW